MKKILAIAPYPYLPYFSGGQKFIANFFEHLGKETDLTVAGVTSNDFSKARNYRTVPILKTSFSRYFSMDLIKKFAGLIKDHGYDLLVIEHPYYAWLANALKKRTGIKTAIHTHNIEFQRFRSNGKWWWPVLKVYEKKAFQAADLIFFITPEDKYFAIEKWKIDPDKCIDLPYGIDETSHPPDRAEARKLIAGKYGINANEKIYFFNGLLDYKPNYDALKTILDKINPVLLDSKDHAYKIVVCGKNLPAEMNNLAAYQDKQVIYGGFTEQIGDYYKASDLFLNPVISGGGVKTKVVESIGYGTTVISTETGAKGMIKPACGKKLIIINDHDWNGFTRAILSNSEQQTPTPSSYYEVYNWQNIIKQFKNF